MSKNARLACPRDSLIMYVKAFNIYTVGASFIY